jgi:hypothetical protein
MKGRAEAIGEIGSAAYRFWGAKMSHEEFFQTNTRLAKVITTQRMIRGILAMTVALAGVAISVATIAQPLPTNPKLSPGLQKLVTAAQAEGSVMVYHTAETLTSSGVLNAFEEKYKIKADTFHATGSPLAVRLANEGATGMMIADAFYSSDTALVTKYPHLFQELSEENFPGYDALPTKITID